MKPETNAAIFVSGLIVLFVVVMVAAIGQAKRERVREAATREVFVCLGRSSETGECHTAAVRNRTTDKWRIEKWDVISP